MEPKEDETPEGKALAEFFHFHFHHHWANQQQKEGMIYIIANPAS